MAKLKVHFSKCFTWSKLSLIAFGLIICFFNPIRNTSIKLIILLLTLSLWLCVLYLCWSKKKIRYFIFGLTAFIVAFCSMPSRRINDDSLRKQYVRSLCYYESKPYVWGAENFFAVDCSGLIRQGLIDANVVYGLKTFNGALVREAILLWWFDSSAKAMRDEYRGRTKQLIKASSINQLDHNLILPGDFAVTQNGVHCLAYLGRWQMDSSRSFTASSCYKHTS